MSGAHLITDTNVLVMFGGRKAHLSREEAEQKGVLKAIAEGDFELALRLADRGREVREAISAGGAGDKFVLENGVVYRNLGSGLRIGVHNIVTRYIIDLAAAKLPYAGLLNFLNKLDANPSKRSVERLFAFLEHKFLPITPDGDFLGYKGVGFDYFSVSSGYLTLLSGRDAGGTGARRIFNGVGEIVECPRNEVDDDPENHCSQGLHVGTERYAVGWGSRTVIVKVNPAHAVTVPTDCDAQKLRVHRYEVVSDYERAFTEPLVYVGGEAPATSTPDEDEDESEDECDNCGDADCDGPCPHCGSCYCDGDCQD